MNSKTMFKISYGMYIVSSKKDAKVNGQIANTVFQITSEPPTVAVSINRQNLTHEFIQSSGVFTASILSKETPVKFIGQFGFKSGRELDKFKDVNLKTGVTGAPVVLENAIGYLECEVVESLDMGTHTIFVGKIVAAEITSDGEPMTYAYYHTVKGGSSPKTAPTYIKEPVAGGIVSGKAAGGYDMAKYKCTVCGYVYEPENGDPDSGVKPGTPFEKVPADWLCPICGAGKDKFEKV